MILKFGKSVFHRSLMSDAVLIFFMQDLAVFFASLDQVCLASENLANFANSVYTKQVHLTTAVVSLMKLQDLKMKGIL